MIIVNKQSKIKNEKKTKLEIDPLFVNDYLTYQYGFSTH